MIQVHRSKKDSVQFRIFPFFGASEYFGHGFFSTDGVGLFPRRQQRAGCSRIHFSRVLRKQKTSGDRAATLLYHSLLFLFGEKLLLRGKVGEILLFPPGCLWSPLKETVTWDGPASNSRWFSNILLWISLRYLKVLSTEMRPAEIRFIR